MEAKAKVCLDGMELELLIRSCLREVTQFSDKEKPYNAKTYLYLAVKLAREKHNFHQGHYKKFAKKYEL